jgi:hypothetical protein
LTACPSCTLIDRTIPVSNGWTTLVPSPGWIFPVADATMSMVPDQAQSSAAQNTRAMVAAVARPRRLYNLERHRQKRQQTR